MSFRYFQIVFFTLFVGLSTSCFAQEQSPPTPEELLQQVQQRYEAFSAFSMQINYRLFRDQKNPKTIERYEGKLQKQKNISHLKIHQTDFITNGKHSLKINHEQKAMLYSTDALLAQNATLPLQATMYLKNFSQKEVYSENGLWVCKLSTSTFTQLLYGTIWIHVNPKTGLIEKQVMEMTAPKGYKDEQGNYTMEPKYLEITFSDFSESLYDPTLLEFQKYIVDTRGTISVSTSYKDYQLYTSAN